MTLDYPHILTRPHCCQDYEGRHHAGVQGGDAARVPAHDRQHGQDEDQQTQGRRGARGRGQVDRRPHPRLGPPAPRRPPHPSVSHRAFIFCYVTVDIRDDFYLSESFYSNDALYFLCSK